jgi:hypothetical protein
MADEAPKKEKKAAKTHLTDPLEAAKMAVPPPPPSAPPAPVVVAAPVVVVPPPAPAVLAAAAKSYRVVKTVTVSLHGQMVRLNAGDIVGESSYGPQAMKRILESNVALEEVK